jgi:ABC-type nitrate/sulfonate/bicarbonate transport system ATPase subunit
MRAFGTSRRLEIDIKHKAYRSVAGRRLRVLDSVAIELAIGKAAAVIGPSGCGTTAGDKRR